MIESTLAVDKGLPPGLWLPTAQESTDKYRRENFRRPNIPYEDIVDYGSFVVALALLGSEQTGRISMMPTEEDIDEMQSVGYGFSYTTLLRYHGGLAKLQSALGFYPRGTSATPEELIKRFTWIAEHAYPQYEGNIDLSKLNMEQLMEWASHRHLAPALHRIYDAMGGDTGPIRRAIGIERINRFLKYDHMNLFRIGAKAIKENSGPLTTNELNAQYADALPGAQLYNTLRRAFGTPARYWLEYGYVIKARGLSQDELVSLGVRWTIEHEGEDLNSATINRLSTAKLFPSERPLLDHFGGVTNYGNRVKEACEVYESISQDLSEQGVDPAVTKIVASRLFEPSGIFATWVKENVSVLQLLSTDTYAAKYVQSIMRNGFNLNDETIYCLQIEDTIEALKSLGIATDEQKRFVFTVVPRFKPAAIGLAEVEEPINDVLKSALR